MYHWQTGRVLHEHQALYILRGRGILESKTAGPQKTTPVHRLGFESQFHFSNAFKQRTGMSPSQWRMSELR
jgi:hypothetical protein